MKIAKYLFAIWAGVLIYALLSTIFGEMGFYAQRQLEKEQRKQVENLDALKRINQDLEDSVNSLLYDKDSLLVFAREQGYAAGEERFIRIVGLKIMQNNKNQAGNVVIAAEPQHVSDRVLRIIAFCAGVTIFICILTFDFLLMLREKSEK